MAGYSRWNTADLRYARDWSAAPVTVVERRNRRTPSPSVGTGNVSFRSIPTL
jgi:hypothetical protein